MCLAVPGKILSITEATEPESRNCERQAPSEPLGSSVRQEYSRTGRVSFGGIVKEVNLAFTPEARVGDYVMVHVGFALSVVDEDEARQIFEYLKSMEELAEPNPQEFQP